MVPEPSDLPLSSSSPGTVSTNGGGRSEGSQPKSPSMANWFKFYETDLTEDRLQWAMGTNPNCAIVNVFLLSKCCSRKSDTIPWNRDVDVLCMASTLKMSCGVANDALRMLEHIEFVQITSDSLKMLNWNNHQSEYMSRKDYFKQRYEARKSGVHSETVDFTQRRGEEIPKTKTRGKPIRQAMDDAKL